MDALDARILRELGMEPFVGWHVRPKGLRPTDVARSLDVGVQLVKDRIARMTADGVITGYRLFPNPRHCGLEITSIHLESADVPDDKNLSRLLDVDGFVNTVWFLDSGLCINLSHATEAERGRRIHLLAGLVGGDEQACIRFPLDLPDPPQELSPLDWRIIRALAPDARRRLEDVAQEVGVTTKTVRTRLNAMRERGSIDEYVTLDFTKMNGLIPFEIAVWSASGADPGDALVRRFRDRLFAHFRPPDDGYCSFILRVFAYTPSEVQALVREALDVEGVERAIPLLATGGMDNEAWFEELLAMHAGPEIVRN